MAIICREYKLLFIMAPATGCTAIGEILKDKFGGEYLPREPIEKNGWQIIDKKHSSISQLVEFDLISKEELSSYVKFATVRNPFDRFVTGYQRLVGGWTEMHMNLNNPESWISSVKGEKYRNKLRHYKLRQAKLARKEGFENWLLRQIGYRPFNKLLKTWLKSSVNNSYFHKQKMNRLYPMIDGVDEIIHYEQLENHLNKILGKVGVEEYVDIPRINKTPGKKSYRDYFTPKTREIFESFYAEELAQFEYHF